MAFTKLEPTGVNTSATFTFSNLVITGTFETQSNLNLGDVSNISIAGGTSGYVLSTDGSGALSWVAQTGGGGGGDYSNSNVAAYLPTYTGNFTAGNISSTGNITAAYFIGNGSTLSGLSGANVTGAVSSATTAETVTTNTQPNITSVGTLSSLTVNNDITANGTLVSNFSAGDEGGEIRLALAQTNTTLNTSVTIDINQNRLRIFESGGTNRGGYFDITALAAGVGTDLLAGGSGGYANSNVASYLPTYTGNFTAGNVSATGNITSAYFVGNGAPLTDLNASNIASGTIPTGVLGNSTVYVGTTSIALNRSSGSQSLTGVSIDGSAGSATIAGTVTTNAQPNITSVGSLNGLTVNGTADFSGASNVSLGPVANVHISGGTSGQYLQTDGTGTLSWATVSGGGGGSNISNGTSNVNIASSGGNITASVNGNADVVVVTGTGANVNGYLSVSGALSTGGGSGGSLSGANVISANYFVGNGFNLTDIAGSNVTGYVSLSSTANVASTVTTNAQPNITSVGALSSLNVTGLVTATAGGIKVGNLQDATGTNTIQLMNSDIVVTGNISAGGGGTGNVTATYFIGNGSQLTGLPATYANSNVETYLPTYTGDLSPSNLVVSSSANLGAVGNVIITGGSSGYVLSTDGSGTLSWVEQSGGGGGGSSISNGTSNLNIAASGGNITASVGGNANIIVVTGTGANVNGYLAVSGSFTTGTGTGGTIAGANAITANYFVGSGSFLTDISSLGNGNSNVSIASAGSNVAVGVSGTANVAIFTNTGANINGNLSVSGTLSAGVGSGGSITGANSITANYFVGKRYAETVVNGGTTSGTLTPDVNQGTIFKYTLNGAVTINALGNAVAGTSVTLILTQDATGSRALTSTMKFAGASKTLTTTANAIDIMSVFYDGTTYYAALSKGYA